VVAVLAVFVFHAAHPFDQFDWHVKNDQRSLAVSLVLGPFVPWGMGLLFLLAGAASRLALPFYVLHQPVILVVAFVVVRWSAGIPVKLAIVLAGSFAITAALCGLVGRARSLGPLLGARPAGGGR
jgi:hypothetical protein